MTPPRRQSVLGTARPVKRTYADDSSDSEAESLVPGSASSRSRVELASTLRSVASRQVITETIGEEKEEENEAPAKKRMTNKGPVADGMADDEKVRIYLQIRVDSQSAHFVFVRAATTSIRSTPPRSTNGQALKLANAVTLF
ncbi:hypothetical protein AM587_10000633 [Phytophthora nicotianae]|nr:hypothetical protein AM587_10000633 [Phytophthora nicotianae]